MKRDREKSQETEIEKNLNPAKISFRVWELACKSSGCVSLRHFSFYCALVTFIVGVIV